jgi:hypothetical protein
MGCGACYAMPVCSSSALISSVVSIALIAKVLLIVESESSTNNPLGNTPLRSTIRTRLISISSPFPYTVAASGRRCDHGAFFCGAEPPPASWELSYN